MTWFSTILILLNFAYQEADSLLQKDKEQVKYYVENIQNHRNTAINLWALAEVNKDKPELDVYLSSYLQDKSQNHPALKIFRDTSLSYSDQLRRLAFATESPLLLVAYLLQEPDAVKRETKAEKYNSQIGYKVSDKINYLKIVDDVLQKNLITESELPADRFHPLHFFLFYSDSINTDKTFSPQYLDKATEQWSFSDSKSLWRSIGLATLYRIFYTESKYNETDRLYRLIRDDKVFPNSDLRLNILRALDFSMYMLGYYNRSLDIIRNHTLPLAEYLGKDGIKLKIRIAQGAYLYRIGKISESKRVYNDVRMQYEPQKDSYSEARIFNNLAINYWKSGEFDRYLNFEFKALEEAEKENNYEVNLKVLSNLFTHYRINNDFESAKQYLTRAKKIAEEKQNNNDLAELSFYEGQLYRDSKSNIDSAITSFNKALKFISPKNNYSLYQTIFSEKATLLEKKGNYREALTIYDQVLGNAQQRDDRRNILYASFNKANSYLNIGDINSARTILDTLRNKKMDALDFYQLVKARTVQAHYQKDIGHPEEGAQLLQPAIDQIVNRSRGSGDLETGFWQVEPEYLDAFELYTNLLINTNRREQAVEVLDRLKTINDAALYQNPLVRSKVLNEKELSEYKRLTDELDVLRKNLLAASGNRQGEIQQKIDEKSARKSMYDNRISSRAHNKAVSINEVQRYMNAYQRVLHITELNDVYYLAVISRMSVEFKKIPITPRLRSKFEQSIREVSNGNTNLKNLFVFNELLGISDLPSHVDKLTIIPDSYLYQMPVDILPLNKPATNYSYGEATYLIERYEINYMTSLNDFRNGYQQSNYEFDYAGYGVSKFEEDRKALVPLPEAVTEIESIKNQLTNLSNKKIFLNANATEQTFRNNASKARILHLATHSEVTGQDPLFSSFYLSRTAGKDNQDHFPGRIFAYELFELNLSNELIMLNSCESGSGSYLQGTGVVGISRALRYAGAQSLILNIWSVNDMMASDFAIKFYEGINNGQSKSDALRKAKLNFLKTKNANPHYWGSYMLLGNEQAIIKPNKMTNNIVAASFILFFLSITTASSILEMKRRKN